MIGYWLYIINALQVPNHQYPVPNHQPLTDSVKIYLKNNLCVEKEKGTFQRYGAEFALTERL